MMVWVSDGVRVSPNRSVLLHAVEVESYCCTVKRNPANHHLEHIEPSEERDELPS